VGECRPGRQRTNDDREHTDRGYPPEQPTASHHAGTSTPWSLLSFGQDSAVVGAPNTVERPHRTGPHGPFLVGDTGSGLSKLEGRAAALGGRLEIESQPAEGTTVRVTVPI